MSERYPHRWGESAEPPWAVEPTAEWQPQFPGQRYPGDIGHQRRRPPRQGGRGPVATGRASVPPSVPQPGQPAGRHAPPRPGGPASRNGRGTSPSRWHDGPEDWYPEDWYEAPNSWRDDPDDWYDAPDDWYDAPDDWRDDPANRYDVPDDRHDGDRGRFHHPYDEPDDWDDAPDWDHPSNLRGRPPADHRRHGPVPARVRDEHRGPGVGDPGRRRDLAEPDPERGLSDSRSRPVADDRVRGDRRVGPPPGAGDRLPPQRRGRWLTGPPAEETQPLPDRRPGPTARRPGPAETRDHPGGRGGPRVPAAFTGPDGADGWGPRPGGRPVRPADGDLPPGRVPPRTRSDRPGPDLAPPPPGRRPPAGTPPAPGWLGPRGPVPGHEPPHDERRLPDVEFGRPPVRDGRTAPGPSARPQPAEQPPRPLPFGYDRPGPEAPPGHGRPVSDAARTAPHLPEPDEFPGRRERPVSPAPVGHGAAGRGAPTGQSRAEEPPRAAEQRPGESVGRVEPIRPGQPARQPDAADQPRAVGWLTPARPAGPPARPAEPPAQPAEPPARAADAEPPRPAPPPARGLRLEFLPAPTPPPAGPTGEVPHTAPATGPAAVRPAVVPPDAAPVVDPAPPTPSAGSPTEPVSTGSGPGPGDADDSREETPVPSMPMTGPAADRTHPGPLADAAPASSTPDQPGAGPEPPRSPDGRTDTPDRPVVEPTADVAGPASKPGDRVDGHPGGTERQPDEPAAEAGVPPSAVPDQRTPSAGPVERADDASAASSPTPRSPGETGGRTSPEPTSAVPAQSTPDGADPAAPTTRPPVVPASAPASAAEHDTPDPATPSAVTPTSTPPAVTPISGSRDTTSDTTPVSGSPLAGSSAGSPVAEASPDTVRPSGPAAGAATALSAPTMLAPIVRPKAEQEAEPKAEKSTPESELPDPEQVLASYQWRFHHETLRELVEDPDELRQIRDRLTEKLESARDDASRARLLSLRAVVSRILGDLGKALADAKLALAHAEATGQLRRIAIAQARLAHVLQWRGDFAEADRLFAEANSPELPDRLRATMHEHAGRSCYDQGRYIEACNHFEKALELRKVEDPDLIARTELALDAVFNKVAQNGWGPYPRDRDEILQIHKPPVPTFSEKVQRWGYADPNGELAIAPSYADVQPFRDGAAWVRRPETPTWELIDETGALLIDASAGYLAVSSFSDGLAWVSRDGTGGWIAIDKTNKVVIPTGFDDVRPFRRGVAAVRRGGWGAVDRTGKIFLPTKYTAFATALTDGRYVDGFTDEGLAIVDAGGRKGVVDKSGKVIVPPSHPAMVIHPVAFLIGDGAGRWGALDRRGEPLIDVVHPSRSDVIDEIDRLLADTQPVL